MSTKSANMLALYNKKSPYKRETPIDTKADKSFGTWSYANMYDALYNKFSQNRNFNLDMWHQAFKLGEQDQYLALLEHNKDTQLSDQFYDSQYYDYESMMLELYKPMANTTNAEERFHTVYDPTSNTWVEESLGEMSDQQYIQYQLDQMRMSQQAEITRALEQERKDELGWWKQFGNDILATMGEFGEGLLSALAGIADFNVAVGTFGLAPYALYEGEGDYLDAFVEYFAENGLTAAEKRTVRAALDEYERTHTHFRDIDGNMTGVGQYVAGISNSIGMMIPAIVANAVTGGAASIGTAVFYASIFSGNMYENATDIDRINSPAEIKILNAMLKTGAEALIEYGLGQLLGGTIQNKMIGMGGRNLNKGFINGFSKTSGLKYFFKSAAQEGLEEFLQDLGTAYVDQFIALKYEGYGNTSVTFQTLVDSFLIGALSSMLMSGGHVAFNSMVSAVQNKKDPGTGDIVIETKDGPQKVTGLNRLQYSQILSDFQQAVDGLKKGKISAKKNIELAQEVYGAMSAISQFYASFDQQRIKNCEMLLDRVVKAEKKQVKVEAKSFAETVETTFRSMLGSVYIRHTEKMKAAAEKGQEKFKEGGVTQVKEFIDTDGNSYKDPAIKDVEERLGKNAVDIIDKLRKAYDFITIVDGHIAYEEDGLLFVSEAWLQNYKLTDIYKYLEQTRVFDALTNSKALAPMIKKIVAFDKEFTKQENITTEKALMDLLFNQSVYQAFLLSNAGKNAHEYKDFIFKLHNTITDLASKSKYHKQLFKGKQAQTRINILNKIHAQIKATMRKPTITAILTWGFDPQMIGADDVLNQRDRELIAQYQERRRVIANAGKEGKHSSRHEHTVEEIIPEGRFTDDEIVLIKKSLSGNATLEEDTEARLLLDEADARMTTFDFDVSAKYSYYLRVITGVTKDIEKLNFTENYQNAKETFDDILDFTEEFLSEILKENIPDGLRVKIANWYEKVYDNRHKFDFRNTASFEGKSFWSGSVDLRDGTIEETHKYEEAEANGFHHSLYFSPEQVDKMASGDAAFFWIDNGIVQGEWRDQVDSNILARIDNQIIRDTSNPMVIAKSGVYVLSEYCDYLKSSTPTDKKQIGLGALTVPHQVATLIMDGDITGAQYVTDVLNEFQRNYGISARQMIMGDLTGISMTQRNQLMQDMEVIGADNFVTFVIKKLESMLGDRFIVTPTKRQVKRATSGIFSVIPFNDALSSEPISALKQTKKALTNWYAYVERRIGRMSETVAERELNKITEILYVVYPKGYSVLRDYLPEDASTFMQDWSKIERNTEKGADVIRWLVTQKDRINNILESIGAEIGYTDTLADTEIYDFVVARKVPVEKVISHDILDLELKQRNKLFENLFYGNMIGERQLMYFRGLLRGQLKVPQLYQRFSKEWNSTDEETVQYLNALLNMSDIEMTNYLNILMDAYRSGNRGDIVNPHTGEVLEDSAFGNFLQNVIYAIQDSSTMTNEDGSLPLSAFIDITKFDVDLSKVTVSFGYAGENAGGVAFGNKIIISREFSDDYFGTFVHELNHILQSYYNLPNGFNTESAELMPDLLVYIANNFSRYVAYSLRRSGYDVNDFGLTLGKITEKQIKRIPEFLRKEIAYCAYRLVQGEIWARTYMHNAKQVHGFAEVWHGLGNSYLLAPDGKTRFKIQFAKESSAEIKPKISPELAGSALDVAVQKLFLLKWRQEREGFASTSRDTYHSYLTKGSSTKLLSSILNPSIGIIDRTFIKLTDVIKNPQQYLAPEILAKCNGDFSEGNVFYRIKEYVEANHEGISLDINEHQDYIWVDDNAFDDLLLVSMQSKVESNEVSLAKQFKPHEKIPLSKFYSQAELNRLGIDPKAYVIIDPTNGGTETIFDREYSHGAIVLDIDENTTDASFINDLNHEFRHLLQYYNGFATGFTADFKVTNEIREDVKKHLPELFKNQEIVKWAKKVAAIRKVKNYEDLIVQRYVYYATSGELSAYGFRADELYAKPVFVNMEAGKPTIFMSWYDAKTGAGRHKTDFLAMRAEKPTNVLKKKGKEGIDIPMVDKKKIKDNRPRYFSKTKAKDTNLEYYTIEEVDQLDPRMQDFIIATTGHEDKLPKELWNSIRRGKLTIQNFYTWFQKAKTIDDFTFNLINKYIFKNDFITSMEQLNELLVFDPAFYWAAAQVLRKRGLPLESLVAENDINKFTEFLKSLEGTKWYDEILEMTEKFTLFQTDITEKGEPVYESIAADDKAIGQMRTLAMEFFNGTLAGAFYIGNTFKQTIYWNEMEARSKTKSADESLGDVMSDDKDVSLIDAIAAEDAVLDENSRAIGNDIMALYELDSSDAVLYIDRLTQAFYSREVDKLIARLDMPEKSQAIFRSRLSEPDKLRRNYAALKKKENLTEQEKKQLKNFRFQLEKYKSIMESTASFKEQLENLVPAEIVLRGTTLVVAQMTNTTIDEKIFDLDTQYVKSFSEMAQKEIITRDLDEAGQKELEQIKDSKLKMDRVNLQHRILSASNKLIKSIKAKEITFDELPANVKELFIVSVTNDKTVNYALDKEKAYYVGKGRKALPGKGDMGRAYYIQKHNLTEGNEAYRHDVSHLIEVDALLRATNEEIKKIVAERKLLEADAKKKTRELEEKTARAERRVKKLETQTKELKENLKKMRTTEVRIAPKQKKRTSDTPNVFNIISAVEMPYRLRKILDTSFEEMANTEVQFASRDESGQLYDKEQFKPKEFESRIKHEVSSWDAFYEANRDALLSLTRNDVLDIIDFFQHGATTIDGPVNKLAAFEIFILGYIVDGARHNFNNWSFSGKEIEIIEKLYEQVASMHGSGLNAVKQMLSVVDPMKKVRQRMFDDWNAISDADKDKLINAVDSLQTEKNLEALKEKGENVIQILEDFGKRQMNADKDKYPLWSKAWLRRQWSQVKSWRYMAMLSGPTTWVRNTVSNVLVLNLNKASDQLARLIFSKKGYRKEQWNLSGVKISTEAKTFIDTYILNNPVFDADRKDGINLYDLSTKYDPRQNKKIVNEKSLFVSIIAKAYEKQYTQDHRFDEKVFNQIAKFIDARISDKKFVKLTASRYFGKILTIEAERGEVDLSKGLSSEALNLFADAVILANQEYMHKRSFGADLFDGIREKYPEIYEALTFWQPFINSSLNWFAESFKYTPLGLAGSIIRAYKLETQITKLNERRAAGEMVVNSRTAEFLIRRDIGKGILGLLLSVLGGFLAFSGRLRIDEDDDKFYLFLDEEIKLDITNIFASSSLLIGASFVQMWIEQSDGEPATFEEMISLVTNTMLDGFFAVDILERHKWGGTWDDILSETEGVMRSFVPQMWQTLIACTNQQNIRYSPGIKGTWERWLNTWVPTQPAGNRRINPYTGELEDKYSLPILGGLLQKGIFGPKVYWVDVSEEERMCREYGVNKGELTGELTVDGKKYELDRLVLNTKYGELNKESLAKIKSQKHYVEMPNGTYQTLSWDKMNDKQRANVLDRTMTHNASIAKIYMWTQMGHKYYASDSVWAELRKLGITQNVYKGDKGFVE